MHVTSWTGDAEDVGFIVGVVAHSIDTDTRALHNVHLLPLLFDCLPSVSLCPRYREQEMLSLYVEKLTQ